MRLRDYLAARAAPLCVAAIAGIDLLTVCYFCAIPLSLSLILLLIGALYVSTVFICMALAILSVKTLSTLDEERRRCAILYRLGVDEKAQKSALRRQIGAFFLAPFAFPLIMTVPMGLIFGKVYAIWDFGLSGWRAMETAVLIALLMAGVYAMYFLITCRIACGHVICYGAEFGRDERGM